MSENDILREFATLAAGSIREVADNQAVLRQEMNDGFAALRQEMNEGFMGVERQFGDYKESTGREIATLQVKSGALGLLGGALVGVPALLTSLIGMFRSYVQGGP